jgi:GNAT superfamily N-acetyltransferase
MLIRAATCADAESIARVQVDTWRTTYRGLVPEAFLDAMSDTELAERHGNHLKESNIVIYVCEDGSNGIIGYTTGGPERFGSKAFKGELYAIYLLQSYQRKGIGKKLFRAVVRSLIETDMNSMVVRVLAENPWRSFYKTLGGKLLDDTGEIQIGGATLKLIEYGWEDLTLFFSSEIEKSPIP